jgi:hypothetical protein
LDTVLGDPWWNRIRNAALVFLAVLLVLITISVWQELRHLECQSGEDPEIEQEFEDGVRKNCDDFRPWWQR